LASTLNRKARARPDGESGTASKSAKIGSLRKTGERSETSSANETPIFEKKREKIRKKSRRTLENRESARYNTSTEFLPKYLPRMVNH